MNKLIKVIAWKLFSGILVTPTIFVSMIWLGIKLGVLK